MGNKRVWIGVTKDTRDTTAIDDDIFNFIDVNDDGEMEEAKIKKHTDESAFTSDDLFAKWDIDEPNSNIEVRVELTKRNENYILNDLAGYHNDRTRAFCEKRNQDCFKGISFVICAFCQTF